MERSAALTIDGIHITPSKDKLLCRLGAHRGEGYMDRGPPALFLLEPNSVLDGDRKASPGVVKSQQMRQCRALALPLLVLFSCSCASSNPVLTPGRGMREKGVEQISRVLTRYRHKTAEKGIQTSVVEKPLEKMGAFDASACLENLH